jgi:transposase
VIDISRGALYLDVEHEKLLRIEPQYVRDRYKVIVLLLLAKPVGITRQKAAKMLHRSKRQVYRILERFKEEGIPGLRLRPKTPKRMPTKSPAWIEKRVKKFRLWTGFSPHHLSILVNEDLKRDGHQKRLYASLTYKILRRLGLARRPEKPKAPPRMFDWKRPNHLIQADLTDFYKVPILTMEDDHSRKAWATVLGNKNADEVMAGMEIIGPERFDNLLTDNGRQFLSTCPDMREYIEKHVTGKHIHARVRHPQTLGKLGAYQKNMKRFLDWVLGETRNKIEIEELLQAYNIWYNHGKPHSVLKRCPEEVYSGKRDEDWYDKFIEIMKNFKPWRCISPSL